MRSLSLLAALAMTTALSPAAAAAEDLTLERVFASPALGGAQPRALSLSPDGRWLTSLRNRPDDRDRYDLWATDTTTGEARMLVDSARIGTGADLSEEEKMRRERARIGGTRGIVAYDWSPDARTILVPLDGDLFVAGLDGNVRRLTETPETELDATVSPRGTLVSFVRNQNLYVQPLAGGEARALTTDGAGPVAWGVAEFVAQEEMGRSRGHWWSPDDSRLAVARVDESDVRVISRAAIGADGTRVYEQRYPLAGTPNAVVELYVMAADGSGRVKVDLGPDPDIYLARVDWTPDGQALLVQRQTRDQKRLDMLRVDPATGRATVLLTETARTWINLHDNLRVLRDGSLLWTSERDGFSHIYRHDGRRWRQLTRGRWQVASITGVNEDAGRLYFTANRESPLTWQLYSMPLGGGDAVLETDAAFTNGVSMDGAATRAIVTRASPTQPSQTYLLDPATDRMTWVERNAVEGDHPYAPYLASHVAPTFGTLKAADGTDLQYKILTPRMEPGRRYPVFVQVYGGPGAGRQVTGGWGGELQQYLVDRGWIVFSLDNRGTPDRGKAFEDAIHRAMGTVEVQDQLAGVEWLKGQDFVDPDRIAVYGWSYGGYMTLKLLEAAPGTFAAGVSGAPVTRWGLYDTHYTERYLGNPTTDPAPYAAADVVPHSQAIADPMLLIHGMADDNVVFEHSTALMSAMQGRGQRFETMVYPGQTHRVAGPGVSLHLWRTILDFLDRNVVSPRPATEPARP